MKLVKYGVVLTRLTEKKIEMVRNWRNDSKIVQYMEFKEYITPEMQFNWFLKINNKKNYYFIIEYNNKEIGLTNIRDIDYKLQEGEGGIFIYDNEFLNSDIPFRASLCGADFCFEKLKLKRILAHILKDNTRAIQFNMMLGYRKSENQENVYNQLYTLNPKDYFKQRNIITHLLNI